MHSPSSNSITDPENNVSTQWKNLKIYDGETKQNHVDVCGKGLEMMKKMGYVSGTGLGKHQQGITEAVSLPVQTGKLGFGLKGACTSTETWDFTKEDINIEEKVEWLENPGEELNVSLDIMLNSWMKEGPRVVNVENQHEFCDENILHDVLKAKDIFDELDLEKLRQARTRANPFETLRSVFFMNRAALKMANIDAATNFMFTKTHDEKEESTAEPFYFADVCAGPGGFTEYILWRKKWFYKGFGLTLKDDNDFRIADSMCAQPVTFQALYGAKDDGNVCCPENIQDFSEKVLFDTNGNGVHFMMSDGGFSVEGKENLQEVLSKNIYICQCLVALMIVRQHGHFVTKLFDVFTPFSVGLLFLMYSCFQKVGILKPNSSRPANSERYFICCDLKQRDQTKAIRQYLWKIVKRLWVIADDKNVDVLEIVPVDVLKKDENFYRYIVRSNNRLGRKQTLGLEKLASFCRNTNLIEHRQEEFRKNCLNYWNIPDKSKTPRTQLSISDFIGDVVEKPEILGIPPKEIHQLEHLQAAVVDLQDWHYCPLYSSKTTICCSFYAGLGGQKVFRFVKNNWVRVKNLHLVKGTFLYGEFVKEKIKLKEPVDSEIYAHKYSLHVIDALRLGDTNLENLGFHERMRLIKIYCKSVNKEHNSNAIRIRPNLLDQLTNFNYRQLIIRRKDVEDNNGYLSNLPTLGFKSLLECYDVNSILLIKSNEYQTFNSTYVLRVQVFITGKDSEDDDSITLETFCGFVKEKL